jgi:hypothetical protein
MAANPNFRLSVGYERSHLDYGSGVEGDRCSMYLGMNLQVGEAEGAAVRSLDSSGGFSDE